MAPRVIVDTGPLVAFLHADDHFHDWAREQFGAFAAPFLSCEAVIAEACHLLRRMHNGPERLLALMERGAIQIDFSLAAEQSAVNALYKRYRDRPASLADMCLVRMTELHDACLVLTLDSDFHIYRRLGRRTIPVLHPDSR